MVSSFSWPPSCSWVGPAVEKPSQQWNKALNRHADASPHFFSQSGCSARSQRADLPGNLWWIKPIPIIRRRSHPPQQWMDASLSNSCIYSELIKRLKQLKTQRHTPPCRWAQRNTKEKPRERSRLEEKQRTARPARRPAVPGLNTLTCGKTVLISTRPPQRMHLGFLLHNKDVLIFFSYNE